MINSRHYQSLSPDDIGFEVGGNVEFVAQHSLCTGCATCEAVCEWDAVTMVYDPAKGIDLPRIDVDACVHCEACIQVCPGFEIVISDRPETQRDLPYHPLIGRYAGLWRGYAGSAELRSGGASGGMVTQLLHFLLSGRMIDGAIVTGMDPDHALQTAPYIARTYKELLRSQKSKYCPTPLNRILKSILRGELQAERIAFVGLPSHVHGLRLLQRSHPVLKQTIPYVISLFTSHVPSRRATEFLLRQQNIQPESVAYIEYRGGGVPGRLRLVLKDGSEKHVEHLDWTFWGHSFPHFFCSRREWLAFDKLSQWADFSMGDNWSNMQDQKGKSTVITRSDAAEEIVLRMMREGAFIAEPMTAKELIQDQELKKKLDIGIRLVTARLFGWKLPIYESHFPVRWLSFPGALWNAINVRLTESPLPYDILGKYIKFTYVIRKGLSKIPLLWTLLKHLLIALMPARTAMSIRLKKHKITMIGGYGSRDIGDEAMPHADRLNLKKLLDENVEIVMLSHDPEYTSRYHGERSVHDILGISVGPDEGFLRKAFSILASIFFLFGTVLQRLHIRLRLWKSAREALDEIASSDLLFNVGGGNLNSIITDELYKKCTTYIAARILRKPVIVSGQTIGPFTRKFDAWYAKTALNLVHMITLRDKETSRERLKAIGVTKPAIADTADDAMTLPAIGDHEIRSIFQEETGWSWRLPGKNPLIVMNMKASLRLFKGQDRNGGLENETDLLARIADELVSSFGAAILFLPTDYSDDADDREVHREILRRMTHAPQARSIEGEYTDQMLKGMIGLADCVIGARYHFLVFAASQSVPFLGMASGLYQQTKLKGLADLCGLPDCFVKEDMEFLKFADAWPQVLNFISHRDCIRKQLRSVVPDLMQRSQEAVREAARLLRERGSHDHRKS